MLIGSGDDSLELSIEWGQLRYNRKYTDRWGKECSVGSIPLVNFEGWGQCICWRDLKLEDDVEKQDKVLEYLRLDRYVPSEEFAGVFTKEEMDKAIDYHRRCEQNWYTFQDPTELEYYYDENMEVRDKLIEEAKSFDVRQKLLVDMLSVSHCLVDYSVSFIDNFRDGAKYCKEYKLTCYNEDVAQECLKRLEDLKR